MKKLITFMLLCSMILAGCSGTEKKDYWASANNQLLDGLSKPETGEGTVTFNEDYRIIINLTNVEREEFDNYTKNIESGLFNIDSNNSTGWFSGYSSDYRYIQTSHSSYDNIAKIDIQRLEHGPSYRLLYNKINGKYPDKEKLPDGYTSGIRDEFKQKVDDLENNITKNADEMGKIESASSKEAQQDYENHFYIYEYYANQFLDLTENDITNEELTYFTEAYNRIQAKMKEAQHATN